MKAVVLFFIVLSVAGFTKHAHANQWIPDYVPVPVRLAHAIPQVYVFNTGKVPVIVIASKLPCEAITGNHSPPGDILRWLANTGAQVLNEHGTLGFDFEIVCEGD